MTRTLFFFTCMAAMLVCMTALLIRYELAYPGVSVLFSFADGTPDGDHFGVVAQGHALFSYLAVILLGTTMCAAARANGARLAVVFMWIGVVFSLGIIALIVLAQIPATGTSPANAAAGTGDLAGWVLDPTLAGSGPASLLDQLMNRFTPTDLIDTVQYTDLTRMLLLPAYAILYIGAYQMLSTKDGFGWVGPFGALLVVVVTIATAIGSMIVTVPTGSTVLIFGLLPFIAIASLRLIDDVTPWLVVLTLGALAICIAQIAVLSHPAAYYFSGTVAEAALHYVFPLGLAWFALPALILYTRPTRMHPVMIWLLTPLMTLALAMWVMPMVQMGGAGMVMRYVDYPDAFARANLTTTNAAVLCTLFYLALVTFTRRSTR